MFTFTLRAALTVAALALATCLGVAQVVGQPNAYIFAIILVAVTGGTAIFRVIEGLAAVKRAHDEEAALADERDRVARDVHDVLGHSLTVVTVKAELGERLIGIDDDRARAELREIQSLTRRALAEIRATVSGLRVARLTDELDAATRALAGTAEPPAAP